MKVPFGIILLLIFSGCGESSGGAAKGIIEKAVEEQIRHLNQQPVILKKTVYYNGESEELTDSNANWETELELFTGYNFEQIVKKDELVLDSLFDERTKRYLVRGSRIVPEDGIQSLYLVLDSQRNLIQFRLSENTSNWLRSLQRELFWDIEGNYTVRSISQSRFGKDEQLEIFGNWTPLNREKTLNRAKP